MASVSSASARLPLTPNVQPRTRLYTGWFESVQADSFSVIGYKYPEWETSFFVFNPWKYLLWVLQFFTLNELKLLWLFKNVQKHAERQVNKKLQLGTAREARTARNNFTINNFGMCLSSNCHFLFYPIFSVGSLEGSWETKGGTSLLSHLHHGRLCFPGKQWRRGPNTKGTVAAQSMHKHARTGHPMPPAWLRLQAGRRNSQGKPNNLLSLIKKAV